MLRIRSMFSHVRLLILLLPAMSFPAVVSAQTAPAQAAAADRWFHPYVIFVVNANMNSGALLPGSFSAFALPQGSERDREQFNVSPAGSCSGHVHFPTINETTVGAKVDFTLRVTAAEQQNTFAPLFNNLYLDLGYHRSVRSSLVGRRTSSRRARAPTTLNNYPISYTPGSLGFFRPQIRVGVEPAHRRRVGPHASGRPGQTFRRFRSIQ